MTSHKEPFLQLMVEDPLQADAPTPVTDPTAPKSQLIPLSTTHPAHPHFMTTPMPTPIDQLPPHSPPLLSRPMYIHSHLFLELQRSQRVAFSKSHTSRSLDIESTLSIDFYVSSHNHPTRSSSFDYTTLNMERALRHRSMNLKILHHAHNLHGQSPPLC